MPLNDAQYSQLLKPLRASRIAKRKQGSANLSYLEAWDVKAHLTRIFGFGGWSSDVIDTALVSEVKGDRNFDVSWKVVLRLTIHGIRADGGDVTYTEAAIGSGHLPQVGEAHDMAIKTAESDALKRAAINLGTQFGLSLYDNGATRDVVMMTLDRPAIEPGSGVDTQQDVSPHGVETQEGTSEAPADEVTPESTPDAEPAEAPAQAAQAPADDEGASEWIDRLKVAVEAKDVAAIVTIKKEAAKAKASSLIFQGQSVSKWCDLAVVKAK